MTKKTWKKWRNEKHYTAKEIAKILKLQENTVYAKESGRRSFTIKEADKLCKLYDISLRDVAI